MGLSQRCCSIAGNPIGRRPKKQTDWSRSVWAQWASYRAKNLIKDDEQLYEIDETLTSMTEDGLLFWLPKFVAEVRKSDVGLYRTEYAENARK